MVSISVSHYWKNSGEEEEEEEVLSDVVKDKCTFVDTCHTKCMVIAIFRMQIWTCMVGAATLDSIFSRNPSGTTEGGPMPVLTPSFEVS